MNTHPYLRAFLAGVFVPTLILPVLLCVFIVVRLVLQEPFPIERGLIFPMAVVPALWGVWNMLHLGSNVRTHLSLGVHGALLPLLLMPAGAVLATSLGILELGGSGVNWFNACFVPYALIVPVFLAAVAGYYLAWKYIVGFVNRTLGIA
ncbi:hypothetical protein [Occallatibacter riparius]|uniref:Uncharacterized protein n=1 Tax=Occallatibacter riparius TaxID=1002689 RepID=A0A9J7BY60_9BACT|nr:hypothetical protein [Occallatibacter riparius]UWZ86102.1 hypothetical protein MOP44_09175 [Occallatibacter riparius]